MKLHFRPKKAVTMIELLVTMVLLSVVTVSAFSVYAYISTYSMRADNYASATEFLCQTLETLSNYSYNNPALSELPADNPHADVLPACNLGDRHHGTRQYTVSQATWDPNYGDSRYKIITATVSWNDGTGRTLTLSVRKTK